MRRGLAAGLKMMFVVVGIISVRPSFFVVFRMLDRIQRPISRRELEIVS